MAIKRLLIALALSAAPLAVIAQPINYGSVAGVGGGGSGCTGSFCAATAPLAPNLGGTGLNNSSATGFPLWTAGVQSIISSSGTGNVARVTAPTISAPILSGSVTLSNITGSTQCLHVNTSGAITGTGSDCGAGGGGLTIGTTTITSGTGGRVLYDNAGVLGEMTTSGSGTALALAASPTINALTVTGSLTATGLVTNADLQNSAITIGGASTALGGAVTGTTILDSIGSTQGNILYRNGANWTVLAPGTSGQLLQSGGAAANPSWVTASGTGNALFGTTSGNTANDAVCMSNTTVGVADCGFAPAQPSTLLIEATNFTLTAAQWKNQDPVQATATLAETFPAVSTLNANGVQLLQNASQSAVVTITPNVVDQVCITGSACAAANTPVALSAGFGAWITVATGKIYVTPIPYASGSGSGTVNAGTSGQVAYYASSSAAVSGQSLSALIDSALGSTQGNILYRNNSIWTVLAPGTSGQLLQSGGAAANPSWTTASGTGNTSTLALGAQSITSTQFNASGYYYVASGPSTLTFSASSGFSRNAFMHLAASGGTITITPNAADQICVSNASCLSAGVSFVIPSGSGATVATPSSGFLEVQPVTGNVTASSSVYGVAKCDGTTITCVNGVMTAVGGGGSGAYTLVSTQTASGSASLSWTGLTGTNYSLVCSNMLTATNGTTLYVQYGTGGTPTWVTTGYAWSSQDISTGGSQVINSGTSDPGIALGASTQSSTAPSTVLTMQLYNLSGSVYHMTSNTGFFQTGGGGIVSFTGGGYLPGNTTAVTAIRVIESSGNITSGFCSLYSIQT